MKYLILLLSLLTNHLQAQSNEIGLGTFIIGVTTPDSLHLSDFKEQEQVVAKGTLTLACTHIRVFKADTVQIRGLSIANLFLVFFDNRLFRITCDYNDMLQKAFVRHYGKGNTGATNTLSLCDKGKAKRLVLESESWQMGDVLALAVHAIGYNAQCQKEESFRLTIASQPVVALSSECDLEFIDPYFEKSGMKP